MKIREKESGVGPSSANVLKIKICLQGLAPGREQVAPSAEPAVLGVPGSRPGHATLPDGPRLRVRALDETDQAVPLLRGGGEPRVHHRRVAPVGHREAHGHRSQRGERHSSLLRRVPGHSRTQGAELLKRGKF